MSAARQSRWQSAVLDVLPLAAGWGFMVADLTIQELYLRMYTDVLRAWLYGVAGLVSIGLVFGAAWRSPPITYDRLVRLLLTGTIAAVMWRLGDAVLPAFGKFGNSVKLVVFATASVLCAALLMSAHANQWPRIRTSLFIAFVLLPLTAFALAPLKLDGVTWPPQAAVGDGTRDVDNVVYLLLDELGAEAAMPLAGSLRSAGFTVEMKPVRAVSDMTTKVVPQMFTGRPFPHARPCGLSTICDATYGLDFSRVVTSRPDIDIVGFYHPYCAIKGLRWCVRASPSADLLSLDRWRCGTVRAFGLDRFAAATGCKELQQQRWSVLVHATLQAVDNAPFWQRGGMLFAHVPLPHPPGSAPGGTLQEHYADNLHRASEWVTQLANRARRRFGDDVRLVVFSDHGLRHEGACASPLYKVHPCKVPSAWKDSRVPIIVADAHAADLTSTENNAQVFLLGRRREIINSSQPLSSR